MSPIKKNGFPPHLSMDEYADFVEQSVRDLTAEQVLKQKRIEENIRTPFSLVPGDDDPEAVSPAQARRFLEQKRKLKDLENAKRFDQATEDFSRIVKMIVEKYDPRRIWQWGSLMHRELFKEYSDIDIAVEGIDDPERFFAMLGDAEKMTDFPLDLLDLNRIEPEFADIIRSKGRIVHEH